MNQGVLKMFAKVALRAAIESFTGRLESAEPADVLKKYDLLAMTAAKYVTAPPPELRNFVRAGMWSQASARIVILSADDPIWGPMLKASLHLEKVGKKPTRCAYVGDRARVICGKCELLDGSELYQACDNPKTWICECGAEVIDNG